VLQLYGSLFYAAADRIESLLPTPRNARRPVVILRLRQQDSLSSTFLQVLERYTPQVQAVGGKVMLAGVGPKMKKQLDATDTPHEVVGEENVFVATEDLGEATHAAVAAAEAWLASPSDIG
jgi:anti-anti-sigma regulatory factor